MCPAGKARRIIDLRIFWLQERRMINAKGLVTSDGRGRTRPRGSASVFVEREKSWGSEVEEFSGTKRKMIGPGFSLTLFFSGKGVLFFFSSFFPSCSSARLVTSVSRPGGCSWPCLVSANSPTRGGTARRPKGASTLLTLSLVIQGDELAALRHHPNPASYRSSQVEACSRAQRSTEAPSRVKLETASLFQPPLPPSHRSHHLCCRVATELPRNGNSIRGKG